MASKEDIAVQLLMKQRNIARQLTADHILEEYDIKTTTDNEQIYVYKDGYYQEGHEYIINQIFNELWQTELKSVDIKETLECQIKPITYVKREQLNYNIELTNVKNGVVNLKTGELTPHDPTHLFTFQLPVNYDPDAECPMFEKFLDEVVEHPDDKKTIYEYIGYCLHRKYTKSKVLTLIGSGRNGKSVLADIIGMMLGEDNCRNLSLHQLEHDQFMKSLLNGMHANINPDIGNQKILASGSLKGLTGNDMQDANVKHSKPIKFRNYAKLIFGANELPVSTDTSYAWISRWIFIKFPHNFDGEYCKHCHALHEVIGDLQDKISEAGELEGIFRKALDHLKILIDNNFVFSMSELASKREKDYHSFSDPVKAFVDECLDVLEDPTFECSKSDVYNRYERFCHNLAESPLNNIQFSSRLKSHIPNIKERRIGSKRLWVGVIILPEDVQLAINGKFDE